MHFQVILQAPPEDAEDLYIQSLGSLGLELRDHDLRWLDESWESPTLAAQGLGWKILLDGLEAGRLCYIQSLGNRPLEPICLEITYCLDCLLMVVTGCDRATDILWAEGDSSGILLRRQGEAELGQHAFEVAPVAEQEKRLGAAVESGQRSLAAGLALPAYEQAIGCLQVLDSLQARGHLLGSAREAWLQRLHHLAQGAMDLVLDRALWNEVPPKIAEPEFQDHLPAAKESPDAG
jgi:glycyl-tRNA synthetase alpha chain